MGSLPKRLSPLLTLHAIGRAPLLHRRYPRFLTTMGPADPRTDRVAVMSSRYRWVPPISRVSRFLDQSFGTCRLQPPRLCSTVAHPFLSPSTAGFVAPATLGRTANRLTRSNRVHLRYGSHLCSGRLRRPRLLSTPLPSLHGERATHMASSFHLARLARLNLALQEPGNPGKSSTTVGAATIDRNLNVGRALSWASWVPGFLIFLQRQRKPHPGKAAAIIPGG